MHTHDTRSSEAVRQARLARHWEQAAALAVSDVYRAQCLAKVARHEARALELAGARREEPWCPSRWMAASPLARKLAGVILGLTVLVGAGSARAESACEQKAILHYEIAMRVGADADAAYEDVLLDCVGPVLSLERALLDASLCGTPTSWAERVPGGWRAGCGDERGMHVR